MKKIRASLFLVTGVFALGFPVATMSAASADSYSTDAIIAGAAGIITAIIYDSNNHPYYIRDNRRYYVSDEEANTYRRHHHVMERRAFVPEQEMPAAQNYPGNRRQHWSSQHSDDRGR